MALILNIDTALDNASVCLTDGNELRKFAVSETQKDHAAWLHNAVKQLFQKNGKELSQAEAVAVSIGPGSYTGLRVGLAAAKGFCFALHIPLITVSTLEMIAFAVRHEATDLICPMIDARRMEVFTAIYDKELCLQKPPHAMIIDENSMKTLLSTGEILFCGNANHKVQQVTTTGNARFSNTVATAFHLAKLAQGRFAIKDFCNLVDAEPLYVKNFISSAQKK